MKKIFYEKVGARYKPVHEYDSDFLNAMPKGTHLLMVYPGGSSTRYNINPNYAAMIAAGRIAEDAVSTAVMKASEMRPHRKPLTQEQIDAWHHMSKVFGDERYYIENPSAREIAEKAVEAMSAEAEKLLKNPAVRKAYEHFMLVCELTKDNNELSS